MALMCDQRRTDHAHAPTAPPAAGGASEELLLSTARILEAVGGIVSSISDQRGRVRPVLAVGSSLARRIGGSAGAGGGSQGGSRPSREQVETELRSHVAKLHGELGMAHAPHSVPTPVRQQQQRYHYQQQQQQQHSYPQHQLEGLRKDDASVALIAAADGNKWAMKTSQSAAGPSPIGARASARAEAEAAVARPHVQVTAAAAGPNLSQAAVVDLIVAKLQVSYSVSEWVNA